MRKGGTKRLFFKAKMAIDADGAARACNPDKQFQEVYPRKEEWCSRPRRASRACLIRMNRGEAFDADSFVDGEFIPYIVLPSKEGQTW
jgi:hypothetical protein